MTPKRTGYKSWKARGYGVKDPHPAQHRLTWPYGDVFYCCDVFNHSYVGQYKHHLVGECAKGFKKDDLF